MTSFVVRPARVLSATAEPSMDFPYGTRGLAGNDVFRRQTIKSHLGHKKKRIKKKVFIETYQSLVMVPLFSTKSPEELRYEDETNRALPFFGEGGWESISQTPPLNATASPSNNTPPPLNAVPPSNNTPPPLNAVPPPSNNTSPPRDDDEELHMSIPECFSSGQERMVLGDEEGSLPSISTYKKKKKKVKVKVKSFKKKKITGFKIPRPSRNRNPKLIQTDIGALYERKQQQKLRKKAKAVEKMIRRERKKKR